MVPAKLSKWFDLPVEDYKPEQGTPAYGKKVYRLAYNYDDEGATLEEMINAFASSAGVEQTTALICGLPNDSGGDEFSQMASALLEHKHKFPKLRGLFLGEMEMEECEISWIEQSEVAPYLNAFPLLEDFRIRGGTNLAWTPVRHLSLRKLVIETGGMPKQVLRGVLESVLPELEHLELWLGTEEYGWNGDADDVRPFLFNNPFPKLRYLGLRNCDQQDEIAILAADAPVLSQLETLDLSLGTLRDTGGNALLASEKVRGLKLLDLHRHYMSKDLVRRFEASGLKVDVSEREEPDKWSGELHYYVAVGE